MRVRKVLQESLFLYNYILGFLNYLRSRLVWILRWAVFGIAGHIWEEILSEEVKGEMVVQYLVYVL
jgi:hypothetical protein